jgi:glycosyltransferase involved in cell wall biosynthesis
VTSGSPAGVIDVVIVAHDAAASLAGVIAGLPRRLVRAVVVVDTASRDATADVARDAGAIVLRTSRPGHGDGCRRAVEHLASLPVPPDVVVFLAGDGRDAPGEIPMLLAPIREDRAELVIGVPPAAPTPEARVAMGLIGLLYRFRFHDLGGFRAIRFPALVALGLRDRASGWNVEMQVRALALGLHVAEVEVAAGAAAVSPGPRGRLAAAGRMLFHIARNATAR